MHLECRLLSATLEFTYNRKRLAELVTKFSGIAFSRLLFRRLIDYSVGFVFWCFDFDFGFGFDF